jgi:hypothetical protein
VSSTMGAAVQIRGDVEGKVEVDVPCLCVQCGMWTFR